MSKLREITTEDVQHLKRMGLGESVITKYFVNGVADKPTSPKARKTAAQTRLAGVTRMRRKPSPRECRPIAMTDKAFAQKHQGRNGHVNVQSVVYEAAEQRLRATGAPIRRNDLLRYVERIVHTRDRTIKVTQVAGALGHLITAGHLHYTD